MADALPQHAGWLEPAVIRELDTLMTVLAFGVDNALSGLRNLITRMEMLWARASRTLTPDERLLSSREVMLIVNGLTQGLAHIRPAYDEIGPMLNLAQCKARKSLCMEFIGFPDQWFDTLSNDNLQQLIEAGRQSNLWMRVAHRRAYDVIPHAEAELTSHALAAQNLLGRSLLHWQQALLMLTERLTMVKESSEVALQTLATICYRTSTRNRTIQEVHALLSDANDIYVVTNDTIVKDFEAALKRLQDARDSVSEELAVAVVQV